MSGSLERIVAIDLGKFKSVACVMQVVDPSALFETIETARRGGDAANAQRLRDPENAA